MCMVNKKNRRCPQQILIENINMLMNETDIDISQLATKSKISKRMIQYILSMERKPTIQTADALGKAFGLTGWQLIIPSLRMDMIKNGSLEKLVKNYADSTDPGKEYISRVAEKEATYDG